MGERLLCKQEVVGSIPSASRDAGWAMLRCHGEAGERSGLGFKRWITAVGRGLALGA